MLSKLEDHYAAAVRMVGRQNSKDFVHHCYLKLVEAKNVSDAGAYLYRIMLNELPRHSEFWKDHKMENVTESIDPGHDMERLSEVIEDLQSNGLEWEVAIFLDCASESILSLSKRTGIARETLTRIFNFVREKIKENYEN